MRVTTGTITSRFGMRMHPIDKVMKMHRGVDISAPIGTPVYCPRDGQVVAAGFSKSEGNYVRVRSGELIFVFMHLSAYSVATGHKVRKRQQIGKVGNTGHTTAPHLHFEVHRNLVPVNPEPYIEF